jgi:hypothetical protein
LKTKFKYKIGDLVRIGSGTWTKGMIGKVGTITAQLEHLPIMGTEVEYQEYEVLVDGDFLYAHVDELEEIER